MKGKGQVVLHSCSNSSRKPGWLTKLLTRISGSNNRRGSRPFLSPEVSQDMGDGGAAGRARSGRRDSLSPDSATDECNFFTLAIHIFDDIKTKSVAKKCFITPKN